VRGSKCEREETVLETEEGILGDLKVLGYAMDMIFKKAWRHVIGRVVQDCFPVPVEKSYYFFYQ
jgi:hypothetical protein